MPLAQQVPKYPEGPQRRPVNNSIPPWFRDWQAAHNYRNSGPTLPDNYDGPAGYNPRDPFYSTIGVTSRDQQYQPSGRSGNTYNPWQHIADAVMEQVRNPPRTPGQGHGSGSQYNNYNYSNTFIDQLNQAREQAKAATGLSDIEYEQQRANLESQRRFADIQHRQELEDLLAQGGTSRSDLDFDKRRLAEDQRRILERLGFSQEGLANILATNQRNRSDLDTGYKNALDTIMKQRGFLSTDMKNAINSIIKERGFLDTDLANKLADLAQERGFLGTDLQNALATIGSERGFGERKYNELINALSNQDEFTGRQYGQEVDKYGLARDIADQQETTGASSRGAIFSTGHSTALGNILEQFNQGVSGAGLTRDRALEDTAQQRISGKTGLDQLMQQLSDAERDARFSYEKNLAGTYNRERDTRFGHDTEYSRLLDAERNRRQQYKEDLYGSKVAERDRRQQYKEELGNLSDVERDARFGQRQEQADLESQKRVLDILKDQYGARGKDIEAGLKRGTNRLNMNYAETLRSLDDALRSNDRAKVANAKKIMSEIMRYSGGYQ